MSRIFLTACAATVALSATVLAADNKPPKGFTALFGGKDFTGWQAKQGRAESNEEKAKWQKHWTVEDGIIKFDGQGPNLWTRRKFKDFVLMVDWRFPSAVAGYGIRTYPPPPGDSGIYLRGRSKSQVNIWCNEMGSGEVWGYRTDKNQP
ncbi:MAG: 3-keto-disaccharide hydrolase, partial [Planctomycetota bacterium]